MRRMREQGEKLRIGGGERDPSSDEGGEGFQISEDVHAGAGESARTRSVVVYK